MNTERPGETCLVRQGAAGCCGIAQDVMCFKWWTEEEDAKIAACYLGKDMPSQHGQHWQDCLK